MANCQMSPLPQQCPSASNFWEEQIPAHRQKCDIINIRLSLISRKNIWITSHYSYGIYHYFLISQIMQHNSALMMSTHSLHSLWNTELQIYIHKGSLIIPILSRINPIPRTNTCSINLLSTTDMIQYHTAAVLLTSGLSFSSHSTIVTSTFTSYGSEVKSQWCK